MAGTHWAESPFEENISLPGVMFLFGVWVLPETQFGAQRDQRSPDPLRSHIHHDVFIGRDRERKREERDTRELFCHPLCSLGAVMLQHGVRIQTRGGGLGSGVPG